MLKLVITKWLKFAQGDLDSAEYLITKPKANLWTYLLVAWHCHQTIEKLLKTILICQNKEILRIHDLPKLLNMTGLILPEDLKGFLFELNQYYLTSRYPDLPLQKSYPKMNQRQANRILQFTKDLFIWFKQQIN